MRGQWLFEVISPGAWQDRPLSFRNEWVKQKHWGQIMCSSLQLLCKECTEGILASSEYKALRSQISLPSPPTKRKGGGGGGRLHYVNFNCNDERIPKKSKI